MSDIQSITVGETWRRFSLVKKTDGSPIIAGSITYSLKALSGDNIDKWWNDTESTWDDSEVFNDMTHQANGSWTINLSVCPFVNDVVYHEYAIESEGDDIGGTARLLRGKTEVTSTSVAGAVWDVLTSTINTTGSIGRWILDNIILRNLYSGTVNTTTNNNGFTREP